jgi:peptidyl-prolyl cis-trans isomerase B (cyclophilin B)
MRRVLIAVAATLALAGCGGSSSGGDAQTAPTTPTRGTNATGCTTPSNDQPPSQTYPKEPPLTIERTTYTATLVTNCGTIKIALDGKAAPHTVNSFAFLAGKHFFDGAGCYRLTTADAGIQVLQCGQSTGGGTGSPGYSLPDEALANAKYPTGTVAMANAGPDTGGSQFFFIYGPSPYFKQTPNYTPFGHVTSGLDVLQRIAAAGPQTPVDGAPKQPVVIESFTVTEGSN